MTVTAIKLADGTDVAASDATCEGCGAPMADHNCGGATGGGSVTYTSPRSTGPRKPKADRPPCAHCGGAMHFNMGGTAVNAECLNRQYSVDVGEMPDPNATLPVLTLERMKKIVEWAEKLATPVSYGKMASAAGGASTYSGLRPKTGRKKKVVPASAGSKIEDMADEESAVVAEESEAPSKAKKSRKGKGKAAKTAAPVVADAEMADADDDISEDGEAVEAVAEAEEIIEEASAPAADPDEAARAERAARRARRKELLRAGNR